MATKNRNTAPTVSVLTLGCKLNQGDSETIARRLAGDGVVVTDRPVPGADAFVINTCSVTHVADRKARNLVRRARRLSPNAQVILTGCYAETAPAEIADVIGADLVLRNADKPSIPDRVIERLREKGDPAAGCPTPARGGPLRTRAFIKIQEGCNELCAFCIVPYTRGREVSVPVDDVVREALARQADGVQEIVLTGTQLGNYGRDLRWTEQGPRVLLQALLERTTIPRIRLSSLQAQDIHPGLVALWQGPRLCRHFHLPLQSGSDPVLGRMRRRYTADQFCRAVALIRDAVPGVAITTDVIAGFPGETAEDFEATYSLCEEVEFAQMHCFPYSPRPHTGAEKMQGHLPAQTRRERLERLLSLATRLSERFRMSHLGQTADVLWEQPRNGAWEGLTGNYIRVYAPAKHDIENQLLPARLQSLHGEGVRGSLLMEHTS
jgi:threonylcarbamoyladenosine tRNA methylthiotransferase MtaB